MNQRQFQTTHRQKTHAMRTFDEMLVNEFRGLIFLAFEDKSTHLGQYGQRLVAVIVVGRTAPERLFVQLYLLSLSAAIDHRSQMGVAYRQCL